MFLLQKIRRYFILSLLIGVMTLCSLSFNSLAAGGLDISTSYTGLEAKAGEEIEFPLEINNSTGSARYVDLSISSIPEGWNYLLEARGRSISQVYVENNDELSADLTIEIPQETAEGQYEVIVNAQSEGITDTFVLTLNVKETIPQESELTVEYPDLEGTSTTQFEYRLNLTNNSNDSQSYSLEASVPNGWQSYFSPAVSSEKIASISVEAGENQGIDIHVIPPEFATEGEYTIPVIAKSADETLKQELKVIIKGSYDINLSTPTGRLSEEAQAGKTKTIKLTVTNNGSSDLENIQLSTWEPSSWEVTFDQQEIEILKAGESKEVLAYVKPDSKAISGDYVVQITAKTDEVSSTAEFRITVRTSTLWGGIGLIVILALIGGLYWLIKKYGRR